MNQLHRLPPRKVVKQIRQGRELPTQAVIGLGDSEGDVRIRDKLVNAGLCEALLDLLDKCSTHTFEQAKKGGDLGSPVDWTAALARTLGQFRSEQREGTLTSVARRIGPLAECMSDPERKFFAEREHWLRNVTLYSYLLYALAECPDSRALLLEQQPVVDFLAQGLFWEVYRPDIMEEISSVIGRDTNMISHFKGQVAQILGSLCTLTAPTNRRSGFVARLADASVVCQSFTGLSNTRSNVTFASGLLELLKSVTEPDRECHLLRIVSLLAAIDYYHEGAAVRDLVEIGQAVRSSESAFHSTCALFRSTAKRIIPTGQDEPLFLPDDELFCVATEAGLFEMCLHLLGEYGDADEHVRGQISNLLDNAGTVVLSRRTGKAIRKQELHIRAKAEALKQLDVPVLSELVEMVEALVDKATIADWTLEVYYCGWCRTRLRSDEKRCCAGCRQIYCSPDCQTSDWKEGDHKVDCELIASADHVAEANGACKKERKNRRMAAEYYFLTVRDEMVAEAASEGCEPVDCVFVVDLEDTAPTVSMQQMSAFLDESIDEDTVQFCENPRLMVERNRQKGALTLACRSTLIAGPNIGSLSVDLFAVPAESWEEGLGSSSDAESWEEGLGSSSDEASEST